MASPNTASPKEVPDSPSPILKTIFSRRDWFCLWLINVKRVNLDDHCQKCFIGPKIRMPHTSGGGGVYGFDYKDMVLPAPTSDEPQYYYLCGVSIDFNWVENFHLPFEYAKGETIHIQRAGVEAHILNARELPIKVYPKNPHPKAIHQKWRTCRNWQWAFDMVTQKKLKNIGAIQPSKQRELC